MGSRSRSLIGIFFFVVKRISRSESKFYYNIVTICEINNPLLLGHETSFYRLEPLSPHLLFYSLSICLLPGGFVALELALASGLCARIRNSVS